MKNNRNHVDYLASIKRLDGKWETPGDQTAGEIVFGVVSLALIGAIAVIGAACVGQALNACDPFQAPVSR